MMSVIKWFDGLICWIYLIQNQGCVGAWLAKKESEAMMAKVVLTGDNPNFGVVEYQESSWRSLAHLLVLLIDGNSSEGPNDLGNWVIFHKYQFMPTLRPIG